MQGFMAKMAAAVLAALAMAAAASAQDRGAAHARNIVFILVDDLRFDGMGFLQPGLRTPHIDALAKAGMYFPNAVVTTSLCSPSRATILTGQSVRNHRIVDNNDGSEEGLVFFPQYLQQAGYQTAFIGKWHMGAATDAPRPGFDKWVSFKGQGTYFPTDELTPAQVEHGAVQMLNVDGRPVPRRGYITDELTDYAIDWLARERDAGKPFFLYLSHKAVHADHIDPQPAPRHAGQYADTVFALPATAEDSPANRQGKPMWVQNRRNSWHGIDFPFHTDHKMADYLRRYYATLSAVDDSVGRILAYLREAGIERDTLVVFYSDNGYMIGDHGLTDKRAAYEPSVRVPMLVYAPGLAPAGATNPVRVRNLDLAPTFLDLAGVPKPPQFEGVSVLPLIAGKIEPEDWQTPDFVYEYYWEWSFPMTPTTFAIERDRVKYIQYHGVWDREELYDLARDPEERVNRIDDPAYFERKIALREALFRQLANRDGRHAIPFTERTSRGVVRRNRSGAPAADFPREWLVEPNRPDRVNDLIPDGRPKVPAGPAPAR